MTRRGLSPWWYAELRADLYLRLSLSVSPRVLFDPWYPEPRRPAAVAEVRALRPGPRRRLPGWKREALLAAIEANPRALDREIAEIAGVDPKTVAAYRERGGPPLEQKTWARLRAAAILAAGEKLCPGCGQMLSLAAFARASNRLDGRQSVCRRCQREYRTGSPHPGRPRVPVEWPPGWDEESVAAAGLPLPELQPLGPLGRKRRARLRAAAILAAGEKWCPRCGRLLDLAAFNRASNRLDGRQSSCRRCQQEYYLTAGQPRPPRPRVPVEWPPGWDEESAIAAGLAEPPPPPVNGHARRQLVPAEPPSLAELAYAGGWQTTPLRFGNGRRRG